MPVLFPDHQIDLTLNVSDNVRIKNLRFSESLLMGSNPLMIDEDRRNVLALISDEEYDDYYMGHWILEKIPEMPDNFYRIKNRANGENLYASVYHPDKDEESRIVFTWTNTSSDPTYEPEYWDQTADWEIIEGGKGYLIKNVKYSEYLYITLSDEENQNLVFTTKNIEAIGSRAYWTFKNPQSGK